MWIWSLVWEEPWRRRYSCLGKPMDRGAWRNPWDHKKLDMTERQHAHTLTLSSLIAVSPWLFNLSHQHTASYNFSWVPLPCLTTTPFFPLFIGKLLKIFVCTFCVQLLPNSLFWLIANQAFITLQSTSAHCWIHVPCSLLICVDVAATSDVLLTLTWNTSQFHFRWSHSLAPLPWG